MLPVQFFGEPEDSSFKTVTSAIFTSANLLDFFLVVNTTNEKLVNSVRVLHSCRTLSDNARLYKRIRYTYDISSW